MSNRCACGREKKPSFPTCWKCEVNRKVQAAYEAGRAHERAVLAFTPSSASPGVPITPARWRTLMQLVHPDRHGGSDTAVRTAAWLNEIRPRCEQ